MLSGQWQRLGVPSLRNPFWGRLALTAAIAVVLLLYITFGGAGAAANSKAIFGQRTGTLSAAVPHAFNTSSSDTRVDARIDGLVHGNTWKQELGNRRRSPGEVPKVLYVSVKDKGDVGSAAQSSIEGCKRMNPKYKVEIMGDAERNATVQKYAPSLLPVYSKYLPTERNDFWSYLMLYLFGGWYIDHDVRCHKPFDEWTELFNNTANAIVGVEAVLPEGNRGAIGFCCPVQYCHWVMGGAPGHMLYAHVVDRMLDFQAIAAADESSYQRQHINNPVLTTGPGILTKAVEDFMSLYNTYPIDVALEKPEMVADLGVMPRTAVAVGGYGTDDADSSLVYVKHMFAGTWKHANSGSW